jgi:hypothetical protein
MTTTTSASSALNPTHDRPRPASGRARPPVDGPRRKRTALRQGLPLLAALASATLLSCGEDAANTKASNAAGFGGDAVEGGAGGVNAGLNGLSGAGMGESGASSGTGAAAGVGGEGAGPGSGVPTDWWKHYTNRIRFLAKVDGLRFSDIEAQLPELEQEGYRIVEVFAPYHSGPSDLFAGLAVVDLLNPDPSLGTLAEFTSLVDACHARGMAVGIFMNPGYVWSGAEGFQQAERDVAAGVDSELSRWFLWSEQPTDIPAPYDAWFLNGQYGQWVNSDVAGAHFFTRWSEQPQTNFASVEWQDHVSQSLRYWMDTGIDLLTLDAVNFYLNLDRATHNRVVTDVVHEYEGTLVEPEGGGAFGDPAEAWISDMKYTGVQDYRLAVWWTEQSVVLDAIANQDPSTIEAALVEYRDKVVTAGGITYGYPQWERTVSEQERLLEIATLATIGQQFSIHGGRGDLNGRTITAAWPEARRDEFGTLMRAVASTPALAPLGARAVLETDQSSVYAFRRTGLTNDARAVVVLNFSAEALTTTVQAGSDFAGQQLVDVLSDESAAVGANGDVEVSLPARGYRVFVPAGS